MMGSGYMGKAIAWLLSLVGAAGVIAGLFGFFGVAITIVSFLILLSGYGLMTADLEDEIQ